MTLSCSTTHSASLTRKDMMPRKVSAASMTADRHASSKLSSDCMVTSILRTIGIEASSLATVSIRPIRSYVSATQVEPCFGLGLSGEESFGQTMPSHRHGLYDDRH